MCLILGRLSRRTLVASIMLVAFASRALIPAGFMPASGHPFSIEICPEDFPAGLLAQGGPAQAASADPDSMDMGSMDMGSMPAHHGSGHSHSEHCVFGTACSPGPLHHHVLPNAISSIRRPRAIAFASIAVGVRLVHLPQSRAPPGRLS
jgi:hypothetical protein